MIANKQNVVRGPSGNTVGRGDELITAGDQTPVAYFRVASVSKVFTFRYSDSQVIQLLSHTLVEARITTLAHGTCRTVNRMQSVR